MMAGVTNRILIALAALLLCSCTVGRFVWYNFSNITDYKIFPARPMAAAAKPFTFHSAPVSARVGSARRQVIDSVARNSHTVALLIIRNDTLLYENYFQGYDQQSIIASFSMAKSFTSALVGAALADGFIKSVEEPITQYVPELQAKPGFEAIKIKHLLQMTSGIRGSESYYNPLGQAAKIYYGRTLRHYITKLQIDYPPGTRFAYRSINTQLLGLIVERATGKTLTEYLDTRIWQALGPEYAASWSIDKEKNGVEKAFCCINARARDFAKFGRLYLHNGNWNGQQVLPQTWVHASRTSSREEGAAPYYKYQWWLTDKGYSASGHLGQYVYVSRSKNLILVRLGKKESKVNWPGFFDQLHDYL